MEVALARARDNLVRCVPSVRSRKHPFVRDQVKVDNNETTCTMPPTVAVVVPEVVPEVDTHLSTISSSSSSVSLPVSELSESLILRPSEGIEVSRSRASGVVEQCKSRASEVFEQCKSRASGEVEQCKSRASRVVEQCNSRASGVVEQSKSRASGVVEQSNSRASEVVEQSKSRASEVQHSSLPLSEISESLILKPSKAVNKSSSRVSVAYASKSRGSGVNKSISCSSTDSEYIESMTFKQRIANIRSARFTEADFKYMRRASVVNKSCQAEVVSQNKANTKQMMIQRCIEMLYTIQNVSSVNHVSTQTVASTSTDQDDHRTDQQKKMEKKEEADKDKLSVNTDEFLFDMYM